MPAVTNLRRLLVASISTGVAISGPVALPAQATSGADLAVRLTATGSFLFSGATYTVSITNHGADSLDSATVVVRLDPRVAGAGYPSACPLDTASATMTCTFGALPVSATATASTFVVFTVDGHHLTRLDATATRTAGSPGDPDLSNDTDSVTCWYQSSGIPLQPSPADCEP